MDDVSEGVAKLTWNQWVLGIASEMGVECDEKEAHDILWSFTAFPFADVGYCEPQVREYLSHKKAGTLREYANECERRMEEASRGIAE